MEETSISAPLVKNPTNRKTASSSTTKLATLASATSTTSAISEPPPPLPGYSYKEYMDPKPYVIYTRDVDEADHLIARLKPGPVAFDMEWCFVEWGKKKEQRTTEKEQRTTEKKEQRTTEKKEQRTTEKKKQRTVEQTVRRTAVVQIADLAGLVIIVHLFWMPRFPKKLQALIENPEIPKLGASILNDGKKLFRDYGILAKNLLELGTLVAAWDPAPSIRYKIISLAKLTLTYCGKELAKGEERTSNWEVPELSERQIDYAANDVHCSMEIYKRLRSLATYTAFDPPAGANVEWYRLKNMQGEGQAEEWRCAYKLWHDKGMALEKMCVEMRVRKEGMPDEGPLKSATVISYVVHALQADPNLPFDIEKLKNLVQMDATSWERHRSWLIAAWFRLEAQK